MGKALRFLDGLGGFISFMLSIVLVIMLMVTPFALSATAMLEPENLAEMVSGLDMQAVAEDMIEDTQNGAQQDENQLLTSFLQTDVAKELVQTYAQSALDVVAGKEGATGFTAEQLKQIVDNNMGQIVDALRQSGVDFAEKTEQEIADSIRTIVTEQSAQILEALPDPQRVKDVMVERIPETEMVFRLVGSADMIKLFWVSAIVALCLVIFLLRIYKWRGFSWVATDLLLGGILAGGVWCALFYGAEQIKALAQSDAVFLSLLNTVLSSFNSGMLIRSGIMLAAAIALFVISAAIDKPKKI